MILGLKSNRIYIFNKKKSLCNKVAMIDKLALINTFLASLFSCIKKKDFRKKSRQDFKVFFSRLYLSSFFRPFSLKNKYMHLIVYQ